MGPHGPAIVGALMFLIGAAPLGVHAERSSRVLQDEEELHKAYEYEVIVTGRVQHIYAPGLFTMAKLKAAGQELLVFVPNAAATPLAGTTVAARGVFRRFDDVTVGNSEDANHFDELAHEDFASRPVLVAVSIITSTGRQLAARAGTSPNLSTVPSQKEGPSPATPGGEFAMAVRPGTLAEHVESLAGHFVRVPNARVVGVFDSRVFLIESQTLLLPLLGNRARVLVFVQEGTLRVAPASLVASTVTVFGVVRTLLGMQVTREVPWPPAVTRELVERLEIRAAVLARSVRTAEGVDLTVRSSSASATAHSSPTSR